MSDEPNDGGPAFPVPNEANVNGQQGMSLRDYFAGQALTGLQFNRTYQIFPDDAELCYVIADAMLAARDRDTTTAQQIALGIGGGK